MGLIGHGFTSVAESQDPGRAFDACPCQASPDKDKDKDKDWLQFFFILVVFPEVGMQGVVGHEKEISQPHRQ